MITKTKLLLLLTLVINIYCF